VKRLARALDLTRATRSRLGKERALADALAEIARDADDADGVGLATAARLASGRTLPVGDPRPLGAGWSLMAEVYVHATGYDADVVRACARKTGDGGEAFGLLVARLPGADDRAGVSLREIAETFDALAASSSRAAKRRRLDALFAKTTPLETKYIAKIIGGSLRTGAMDGVLEGAMAKAFDCDVDTLRRAWALVTDPGVVAVLARDRRLHEARMELGRPIAYMLATPIETIASEIDPSQHVAEDKIDGVRAQLHKVGSEVHLFARGLERVTASFPEVVDAYGFVPGSFALDGELVALAPDGRPRPFQALQTRLRRVSPSPDLLREIPVTFVAYDLLADDEGDRLALPWRDRRALLDALARDRGAGRVVINPVRAISGDASTLTATVDVEFDAARARGHEGLVLKRVDAPYDAGRRGQAWIKVKKAFATLDVVVTAAEEGHGKRAGVLSDYTFGVWRGEDLVNVGKAYSGLTDDEIDALTRRFEKITMERYGGVRAVKPEVVLEVAFDGVQPSSRHKSGFALRFPRIVRIRDDKTPEQADRIEAVEALFASQVDTGHREATPTRAKRSARKAPPREQLSLFDARPTKK
jgi:DNA ligase-1